MLDTYGLNLFAASQTRSVWDFMGQYGLLILPPLLGLIAIYLLLPKARQSQTLLGCLFGAAALILAGIILVQTETIWVESLLFYAFAAIAVIGGSSLITHSQPVRAALSFTLVILSTCGLFLLLGAPFLMAATIIVYAGAIIVTFLFVIMLAQQSGFSSADHRSREPLLSTLASFVLLASLACVLHANYHDRDLDTFLGSIEKAANAETAKEVEEAIGAFARFDADNNDELSSEEIRDAFAALYDGKGKSTAKNGKLDADEANVAFRAVRTDLRYAKSLIETAVEAINKTPPGSVATILEPAIRTEFLKRFLNRGDEFKNLDNFYDALLRVEEPLLSIPMDYEAASEALRAAAKAGVEAKPPEAEKKDFAAYLKTIKRAADAKSSFEIEKAIGVLKRHHQDESLLLNAKEVKAAMLDLYGSKDKEKLDKEQQTRAVNDFFGAYVDSILRQTLADLRSGNLSDESVKLFEKHIRKAALKAFITDGGSFARKPALQDQMVKLDQPLTALVQDDSSLEAVKEQLTKVGNVARDLRQNIGSLKPPQNLPLSPFDGVPPNKEPKKGEFELPPNNVSLLGRSLFTHYLLAVELAGLLLLVASIGAIAIAGRRSGELQ